MNKDEGAEMVKPTAIAKGDVIEDPVGHRWVVVHDVQMITDANGGAYSFYGAGPEDRITFEADERVKRRTGHAG